MLKGGCSSEPQALHSAMSAVVFAEGQADNKKPPMTGAGWSQGGTEWMLISEVNYATERNQKATPRTPSYVGGPANTRQQESFADRGNMGAPHESIPGGMKWPETGLR